MRKKLGTRFPASRIKKIMQADEDVGKMALAVPLLVSKALELFLQDLCDRTYEITLQRGAKTLNSSHLLSIVLLTTVIFGIHVSCLLMVPNLGGMETSEDDKGIGRRRKTLPHEDDMVSNEDLQLRSPKMATMDASVSPRLRGRGRGRGRGRPPTKHREERYVKCEDDDDHLMLGDRDEAPIRQPGQSDRVDKENNPEFASPSSNSVMAGTATSTAIEIKRDQQNAWHLPDGVANIGGLEPPKLVQLTMQIDEDEDYDNED